jgi:ribosomal protein L37AE/L43A
MEMICPECGRIESFERLPMRLQTCSTCADDGVGAYLTAPSLERRQPIPQRLPTGRALLERRRLARQRPAV